MNEITKILSCLVSSPKSSRHRQTERQTDRQTDIFGFHCQRMSFTKPTLMFTESARTTTDPFKHFPIKLDLCGVFFRSETSSVAFAFKVRAVGQKD